jgi:hypothetical protein
MLHFYKKINNFTNAIYCSTTIFLDKYLIIC